MNPVRVLVVEDSLTVRKRLCELIAADPRLQLVGEAEDGKQALAQCLALRPDVISLDMMLPQMSGLAVTEYVMAHCPTPILVVSSSFNRGELFRTYEALAAGALDVMEKPSAETETEAWEQRYIAMLLLISRIRVITHPRARLQGMSGWTPAPLTSEKPGASQRSGMPALVAIGASTGGPRAVVEVLKGLPADVGLSIVLVMHISDPFGADFAEWLNGQTPHAVRFAENGEPLGCGVFMAPPSRHLLVERRCLWLNDGPERHSCKPSVDVLFESVARDCGGDAAACLLTGMGTDGARGLLAIRQMGGLTIAQDEASCVVYGMPREAARLGAASYVLPLDEIGPMLARKLGVAKGNAPWAA
ncbi:MAG: chemotaxis-specific protein-glutamate methyltransferase CheB [Burkholderiales bacterium]|nr:chemotaxis-specific protein-glutamate methyltransferase CheB [Burkholderiales bacterium]